MEKPRYTVYEFLEILVNRVNWGSETVLLEMLEVVYDLRDRQAFGVMVTMTACDHDDDERVTVMRHGVTTVTCGLCGRILV